PWKAREPERVVREPSDLADADVAENLRPDAEVAERRQPRREARAGTAPAVAGGRREEIEPAALATQVEHDAAPLGGDALHGAVEQAPGITVAIAEHVSRHVLDVGAHERRLVGP